MTIRSNRKMQELLGDDLQRLTELKSGLPESLVTELDQLDIGEKQGLVLIGMSQRQIPEPGGDPTGAECLVNSWFIKEAPDKPPEILIRVAIHFALELKHRIQASLIRGNFRLIISGSFSAEEVPSFGCTVRFHKIRPGNPWLLDDLEGYEGEALLALDWTNNAESMTPAPEH